MEIGNEILTKIDWDVLNGYIDNNLIVANKHSEYDIWILNYSPKIQYNNLWDLYTISCRGMIIDHDGNILARPFKKFKNYEEHGKDEIPLDQEFEAFEKMDGSLIILFYYQLYKEWIVASRESFISEQSQEAKKILKTKKLDILDNKWTYLFEIIYPENRIVVDYGSKKDLILLGRIETSTGFELYYDDLLSTYSKYFTVVKRYPFKTFNEVLDYKNMNLVNKEGLVIRFLNGFRIKLILDKYIRLHAILTNISNLTVWENLMNGYDFDEITDRVPNEFYVWLNKTIRSLKNKYMEMERDCFKEFIDIIHNKGVCERKMFAMEALKSKNSNILFMMYDKNDYSKLIWKRIKPKYSKPFVNGYDVSP